jgi:diguanylate cyclase (GGDEF)-like protein
MKRLIPAFALLLACASAAWAAEARTLTSLRAITLLSHAQAAQNPPVDFEATVTYRRQGETTLFVQDGDKGLYVWANSEIKLTAGDRVRVRGKAQDSFSPIVIADSVAVLHSGSLPDPVPVTFDELIRSERDCMRVIIRGHVHSADVVKNSNGDTIRIQLAADGGTIEVFINDSDPGLLNGILDADVEIAGVAGARFDGKMQHTGVGLSVPFFSDIKILKRAGVSPWSLPVTQMDEIMSSFHETNLTQRVRVHGTITYYQPGSAFVLQSGAKSLWIMTKYENPLRVGLQVDVTGFPEVHDGFLTLTDGEVQPGPVYAPIAPAPVTRRQLTSSKNLYDLVTIEGQVVTELRESAQDEYVLVSDGQLFSAILRDPEVYGQSVPAPMKHIPLGSRVSVAGICILENSNPYGGEVPFNILMRTPDDIAVVARPSLVNTRNLILLVGLLLAIVVVVGARGWAIERRMRRQTTASARIEQRRSRILEDINGSRPLAEIIEEIAELVSFNLDGAPCWCQIADGARLGNFPPKLTGLRVVRSEIPARSGPPLGSLFVAFDPLAKPCTNESTALSMAVALATLAIETRRLYSDLLHRSEFDLLTDIHNRFSLDKYLDRQIEEARQKASIFGLIYIDLDKFKQVNDLYGHQFGDLYLQEVALRMKRQLRNIDMLARLGGDEFAALVPVAHSRAEVEEIAQRLDRSFEEPFIIEDHLLRGAASIGIALYPEDGASKESLLSAADTAMYAIKNRKQEIEASLAQISHLELSAKER